MTRPRIWREAGWWCYEVPGAVPGRTGTWREAYERVNSLVRAELARLGVAS